MRKILLASTALVALGSFSAHAADITISGGYNFIYTIDGENTADETTTAAEGDVNIKFSNTTDSGITTTLNYGLHETGLKSNAGAAHVEGADGAAYDDLNASMSSDFGTLMFDSAGDDTALGGFDAKSDKAGEGSQTGALQGIMGTGGLALGYKLPSIMDGLTIAINSSDTADEYFGYGIGYDMGMINVAYVKEASNTVEQTYAGLGATFGEISVGIDSVDQDNGTATTNREALGYGASYAMGDITLAYEMGKLEDGAGTEISDHTQIAASYAVAPGITAVFTQSEVEVAAASGTDEDKMELQLKLSF